MRKPWAVPPRIQWICTALQSWRAIALTGLQALLHMLDTLLPPPNATLLGVLAYSQYRQEHCCFNPGTSMQQCTVAYIPLLQSATAAPASSSMRKFTAT